MSFGRWLQHVGCIMVFGCIRPEAKSNFRLGLILFSLHDRHFACNISLGIHRRTAFLKFKQSNFEILSLLVNFFLFSKAKGKALFFHGNRTQRVNVPTGLQIRISQLKMNLLIFKVKSLVFGKSCSQFWVLTVRKFRFLCIKEIVLWLRSQKKTLKMLMRQKFSEIFWFLLARPKGTSCLALNQYLWIEAGETKGLDLCLEVL